MITTSSFGLFGADSIEPLDAVISFLQEKEIQFVLNEEAEALSFGIGGEHGDFDCAVELLRQCTVLRVTTKFPVVVPSETRTKVGEFLLRFGYGLILNQVAFNFVDGEARIVSSVPLPERFIDINALKECLIVSILTADSAFPALLKVIYGKQSASEAAEEAVLALSSQA